MENKQQNIFQPTLEPVTLMSTVSQNRRGSETVCSPSICEHQLVHVLDILAKLQNSRSTGPLQFKNATIVLNFVSFLHGSAQKCDIIFANRSSRSVQLTTIDLLV